MVSNFDLNRTALNNQMMGLSTDTKPTNGIIPNSLFWELDTNGMYYFDGTQWQSIGGSGGGGGDDLIELEYTVANSTLSLTKTPAELYELIQAGKNFKLVVNSDLARYGGLDVGDVFISVQYTLDNQDSLQTLDFYIAPLPTNQGDTGGKWYSLFFGISNGVMECAFD